MREWVSEGEGEGEGGGEGVGEGVRERESMGESVWKERIWVRESECESVRE